LVSRWCDKEGLSINPLKTVIVPFTKKRVLPGLTPPILDNIIIPFSTEAKYLGVTFDQKLTWNPHFKRLKHRATTALGRCRRLCGKNWGLKPKLTLWLYTRVIRPMITYGAVAWWSKTTQVSCMRQLSSIQRLACINVTGAMRTAPTAALEALLNLTPLHLHIQGEVRVTIQRLLHGQGPVTCQHNSINLKLFSELKAHPILGMPEDVTLTIHDFDMKFQVVIPNRDTWKTGRPRADQVWYTDGSKMDTGTGAGIYEGRCIFQMSVRLGKYATVFQAELIAIYYCVCKILENGTKHKTLAICSDSQVALKAISTTEVNSKLVWDCLKALSLLGEHNKVILFWVPGHEGYKGNEEADRLAREDSKHINEWKHEPLRSSGENFQE
jgi:ribonuclease HI